MKVKCIVDLGENGDFTFGKTYKVIREDLWLDYIVYNDHGKESFLEEHECEVIEETPDTETSVEYTGEGLPPIGTVCEFLKNPDEWLKGTIFGHRKNKNGIVDVFIDFESRSDWDYSSNLSRFRPIKSEKQKEVEELNKHLDHWFDNIVICPDNTYDDLTLSQYLYNLGYRKTK